MVTTRVVAVGLVATIATAFVVAYTAGRAMRPAGAKAEPTAMIAVESATISRAGPTEGYAIPPLAEPTKRHRDAARERAETDGERSASPLPEPLPAPHEGDGQPTPPQARGNPAPPSAPSPPQPGRDPRPPGSGDKGGWSSGN